MNMDVLKLLLTVHELITSGRADDARIELEKILIPIMQEKVPELDPTGAA